MSKTVRTRRRHADGEHVTQTRQPRPALRRQGTRSGVIRAAMREW